MFNNLKLKILRLFNNNGSIDNSNINEFINKLEEMISDEVITFDEAIQMQNMLSKLINSCITDKIKTMINDIDINKVNLYIQSIDQLLSPIKGLLLELKGRI